MDLLALKYLLNFYQGLHFFFNYLFMKTRCSYIEITDSNQAFSTKCCLLRTDLPTPRFSTTAILLTSSLSVFDTKRFVCLQTCFDHLLKLNIEVTALNLSLPVGK